MLRQAPSPRLTEEKRPIAAARRVAGCARAWLLCAVRVDSKPDPYAQGCTLGRRGDTGGAA